MIWETKYAVDFLLELKLLPSFFFIKMNDVLLTVTYNSRMKIKFVKAVDCEVVAAWLNKIHVHIAHRFPVKTLKVIYFNTVDNDWWCVTPKIWH